MALKQINELLKTRNRKDCNIRIVMHIIVLHDHVCVMTRWVERPSFKTVVLPSMLYFHLNQLSKVCFLNEW